jgi:membrane associated rhomboid family serine protease
VVGVGASGAIFGTYGIFLAFLLTGVFPPAIKKGFLAGIIIFIVYNLVMGIQGTVDNAAHIGGLVSGILLGLVFSRRIKSEKEQEAIPGEEAV